MMPKIDIEALNLSGEFLTITKNIINSKTGELRASKPKDGESAYVWRMVAFQVSPKSQHQCIPVTADFGFPEKYWNSKINPSAHDDRRKRCKELDVLVDLIVNQIPKNKWHGILRWSKALGY